MDLPIVDSQQSLVDIIDYLQSFDKDQLAVKEVEEEQLLPSPVTDKGDANEEVQLPIN